MVSSSILYLTNCYKQYVAVQ